MKIVDFGSATEAPSTGLAMTVGQGTPQYMAPEVLLGEYEQTADIYRYGEIVFSVLVQFGRDILRNSAIAGPSPN